MPAKRLKKFLDDNNVKYTVKTHSQSFTAQQISATTHISGKDIAKTVMIKIEGKMAMAVLPGSYHVDFRLLREAVGNNSFKLATEEEFKNVFPECEVGAMPPFGNLFGIDVYVAKSLAEDHEIAFNAGSHTELIQMAYRDFERLVQPTVIRFAVPEGVL